MQEKKPIESIKNIGIQLISSLESLAKIEEQNHYSFEIDCDELQDYNNIDIRNSNEHSVKFNKLAEMVGPVVYWFEIISDTDCELIRQKISEYSNMEKAKSTPAMKKQIDLNSRYLYVGKVKRKFWGRIIQHMGYYKVNRTQGLQLYHWAKGLNLKLRVHAIEFEDSMIDLVSIIELKMAKSLKPIIGKHK